MLDEDEDEDEDGDEEENDDKDVDGDRALLDYLIICITVFASPRTLLRPETIQFNTIQYNRKALKPLLYHTVTRHSSFDSFYSYNRVINRWPLIFIIIY